MSEEEGNGLVASPPAKVTLASAYSTLGLMRGTEVNMRWEGAKLGMYFNIPGFAAVASLMVNNGGRGNFVLIVLGAFFASALNEYLYKSIRRSGKHFHLWNSKMVEVEEQFGIEGGIRIFSSKEYKKLQRDRLKIQNLLLVITRVCIVAWAVIGLMALGVALFGGDK